MSKPSTSTLRDDDLLLVNAYLDGELDAAAILDVERRLSDDARLKAEYDRLFALRAVLASELSKETASEMLRNRIAAIAAPPPAAQSAARVLDFRSRTFDWRQMAASILVAGVMASGATVLVLPPGQIDGDVGAIVVGHQRALLAATPVDVASSDRHTVKPWFDSKLALSPQVIDLAASGFPLAGGRVDVVAGKPVPTLVYRRREHLISLTAVPKWGGPDDGKPPSRHSRDGYTVLAWRGQDFAYSAVSDLAPMELEAFVSQWRAESKAK